jgi:hypothetical protein
MRKQLMFSSVIVLGALPVLLALPAREAQAQVVFQAAEPGPALDAAAILGAVEGFRAALGDLNTAGPQLTGRREINWDGGGSNVTTPPVNPFDVFLNARGARFIAPGGVGLSQAPPSGGPQGGLAVLFNNPAYATDFTTFSAPRLFTPVGSRVTEARFFVPGTNGGTPAAVTGFGAVFTDVDQPSGESPAVRHSTRIEYYNAANRRIYTGFVPAAPGSASLSFFGVVFPDPVIARVRIVTGDAVPGLDDAIRDIVMMDDFIYGEPQALP